MTGGTVQSTKNRILSKWHLHSALIRGTLTITLVVNSTHMKVVVCKCNVKGFQLGCKQCTKLASKKVVFNGLNKKSLLTLPSNSLVRRSQQLETSDNPSKKALFLGDLVQEYGGKNTRKYSQTSSV